MRRLRGRERGHRLHGSRPARVRQAPRRPSAAARRLLRGLAPLAASARAALLALALLGSACGLPTGDLYVYPADAPELAHASVQDGVWESAPWSAPDATWLPYPPRATLQLEHGLGRAPRLVTVYLSFEEDGREAAMAAGDLARVLQVDEATLTVRNDTSARYFARVVAR